MFLPVSRRIDIAVSLNFTVRTKKGGERNPATRLEETLSRIDLREMGEFQAAWVLPAAHVQETIVPHGEMYTSPMFISVQDLYATTLSDYAEESGSIIDLVGGYFYIGQNLEERVYERPEKDGYHGAFGFSWDMLSNLLSRGSTVRSSMIAVREFLEETLITDLGETPGIRVIPQGSQKGAYFTLQDKSDGAPLWHAWEVVSEQLGKQKLFSTAGALVMFDAQLTPQEKRVGEFMSATRELRELLEGVFGFPASS